MLMSITLWNVTIQKLNQLMRQSHLASKIDKNDCFDHYASKNGFLPNIIFAGIINYCNSWN